MKHSTQILLLLFSLSVLTFSQETEAEAPTVNPGADSFHACNPIDRPTACTFEYVPVCGYIHDCEGGDCTVTFGNKCAACAEENVDGYVEGACEDVREVCNPDNRPEVCPLIYTATCAVASDCQGPHCFEDTSNSCMACGMDNVAYSLPGTCPSNNRAERTYCDPNRRPEACTLEWDPVCAHRASCVGDTCYYTAGNPCGACTNTDVDYHIPGECSDDELGEGEGEGEGESEGELNFFGGEDRTYCDPDNRPEICTADYTPVCAHREGCDGDDCFYTAGNACGACGDPDVDWHVPGECPNDDTDGEDDTDDERTYCDADNRPGACTKEYNPVCAHQAGCEGDGCEYTAGNACMACSDVSVDYHTPGEC